MLRITTVVMFLLVCISLPAQYDYEASEKYPFGQAHPDAPEQIKDFEPMIGVCKCESLTRKRDGTWAEPEEMIWRFKYIMNGMAVQDETLKPNHSYSGSIRQFFPEEGKWFVHYYSHLKPSKILPAWEGEKADGKIVLYREQKAPNGMDGFYRLTFYDMSEKGYKWVGEWVSQDESISFPTWKIDCKR